MYLCHVYNAHTSSNSFVSLTRHYLLQKLTREENGVTVYARGCMNATCEDDNCMAVAAREVTSGSITHATVAASAM